MFQTHNSYHKSKELDANNCVESWELGLSNFPKESLGHFL